MFLATPKIRGLDYPLRMGKPNKMEVLSGYADCFELIERYSKLFTYMAF